MEQELIRQNIRQILEKLELTPYSASKRAGLNTNTLLRFLKGDSKSINETTLQKISDALEIDIESFKGGKIIRKKLTNDNSPINKSYMKRAIECFEKEFGDLKLTSDQENDILTSLYQKIVEVESMKEEDSVDNLKIEETLQKTFLKIIKK